MFVYNNVAFQKMPGSEMVILKADVCNDVRKDFLMLEGIKAPVVTGVTRCDIVFESGY